MLFFLGYRMNFVSFTSESICLLKPIKTGFLAKSQSIILFWVTLVDQSKHFKLSVLSGGQCWLY